MPRPMTEEEREAFLAETRVCVIAIATDDGRPPLTIPVWYAYRIGGDVTFFTGMQGKRTRKARLLRRAGRLSISVQAPDPPYRFVTVEGTLLRVDQPPTADQMLEVVGRYLPEDMAEGFVKSELDGPGDELVLFTVRPDRWLSGDFSED